VDQNKAAAQARRRKASEPRPIRAELLSAFRAHSDRTDVTQWADVTGGWRDGALLTRIGPSLAALFEQTAPTVVLAPQSRGTLLGALVAADLRVGLIEIRKNDRPSVDSDGWRHRTTPPDYRNRHLRLGFPKRLLLSGERVLFVDDWIASGGQAVAARGLVDDSGAIWLGAAVLVDGLTDARLRRDLCVRSILHHRDMWS